MNTARNLLIATAVAIGAFAAPLTAAATNHGADYPEVRTRTGVRLFSADEIRAGERAWAALTANGVLRGKEPAASRYWQADWLRRERAALRDMHAQGLYAGAYAGLMAAERGVVDRKAGAEMTRESYDPATNAVTVSVERGEAISEAARHYMFLFGDASGYGPMRARHALPANALPNSHERRALAGYLFWSAWSSAGSGTVRSARRKPG